LKAVEAPGSIPHLSQSLLNLAPCGLLSLEGGNRFFHPLEGDLFHFDEFLDQFVGFIFTGDPWYGYVGHEYPCFPQVDLNELVEKDSESFPDP